jgi:hypothetical protein
MSKRMIRLTTMLLTCAVIFTLAGVAEAGHPAHRKAPTFTKIEMGAPDGLLSQVWVWLASFWTGTQTLEKTAEGSGETTSNTTTCTNPQGCDAGWGLDPNG